MDYVDAIKDNASKLAQSAQDLRDRINTLQANGHTADATTNELLKTCNEIGRLNEIIKKELDRAESGA